MEKFVEAVYDSLQGELLVPVPGVKNMFAQGEICALKYQQMWDAYLRLCMRLGVVDEDEDVEIIICALMDIQKLLAIKMYEYGAKFGYNDQTNELILSKEKGS